MCDDGTRGAQNYTATWEISAPGRTAIVNTGGNCPPYLADVEPNGVVAHFREKQCQPDFPGPGEMTIDTLVVGTLTLSGDRLDATMNWRRDFFDESGAFFQGSCTTSTGAALTRRR